MFKTIFSKMITIFVLILAIAFAVTGVMLNYFLDSFVTKEKARTLEQSSDAVNRSFGTFLENRDNPLASLFFQYTLESIQSSTRSLVWIVDEQGHILLTQPELPDSILEKYKDGTGKLKLPDVKQYGKAMSGLSPIREIGDFFGFFREKEFEKINPSGAWLTVEKVYPYKGSSGENIKIGVFLHTPVPEVQSARNEVFKFFMLSVGAALVISFLLVYIFSLRISRPLKQINAAARIIAGGEFRKRLDIKTRDEIGQLAQSFNQMGAALQNLEEMRRGFIANVSHELRTPMTSIRGFVEGILDGTIPRDRQEYYLTIVRDETNRLNRLVNDLLDLAKMEAGEVTLHIRDFDLNELVRRCVIKLETFIVDKELQVEADFEEEDTFVNADPDAIERVLYNLVHNAIKFTPEGGRITIRTRTPRDKRDKVQVTVEDTGIGIESQELSMIWDRFYKSDKSRSRDKTGTGLGLAIARNIILEHNEQIEVESEPGQGTRFTFSLKKVSGTPRVEG